MVALVTKKVARRKVSVHNFLKFQVNCGRERGYMRAKGRGERRQKEIVVRGGKARHERRGERRDRKKCQQEEERRRDVRGEKGRKK